MMTVVSVLLVSSALFAQDQLITTSGTVADAKTGVGIPGISVAVKGGSGGTTTNSEGSFTLKIAKGSILVFSSVGYQEIEQPAEEGAMFVVMTASSANLNEVVVVGYGTVRKKDLTGAVATIGVKDFQTGNMQSPDQLIAGKVAGVQVIPNGGSPGAGSTIRIRGGSSLNASNNPLIVIDGVPVAGEGIAGSANLLNTINPNDIETFNILKDASATAIYGSRASNGVILITTKKGKKGKPQIDFSTSVIYSVPTRKIEVWDANQFRDYVNANGSAAQKAQLGTANTNWQDEIYQNALGTDNNLSFSGSWKNMPFRISGGYLNQDGILKTDNLTRYSTAIGISPKFFNNHLKVDVNLKGTISKNRFADQGAIGNAVRFDPTQPVQTGNKDLYGGFFEWESAPGVINNQSNRNPVALLELRDDRSQVMRSIGNVQLDYKFHFLPELRANVNLGYDISRGEGTVQIPAFAGTQKAGQRAGTNNEYSQESRNQLFEGYLNYAKDIKGINSRIDVTAGYSYQDFLRIDSTYPDFLENGSINPTWQRPPFTKDYPRYTLISYFGRLNYTLANKYLLTATVRRDGSSRFNPDTRWGMFPAVALAWKMTEEDFLKDSKVFSDLKFRIGYGVIGQQDLGFDRNGLYPYIASYTVNNPGVGYIFGQDTSLPIGADPYNYNLKWEENHNFNIGFDFGLFDNKFTGSIEYFNRKSKDLLASVIVPAGTNFATRFPTNIGDLTINGGEFTLNYTPIRTQNFTWDLNANVTYLSRKITKLAKGDQVLFGGIGIGRTIQVHTEGEVPGAFLVFKQIYDDAGMPIEGLYEDLNRDGVITDADKYSFQKPDADMFFGFSSNFTIGKFNTGFVLRGSVGNYVYDFVQSEVGVYRNILNPTNFLQNTTKSVTETNFNNNRYWSDFYVKNASFLRMDNLNFGYELGSVFGKGSRVRLTANIQNVFTITKYQGIDPEVYAIDGNYYPRPRIFVFGVNVGF
jgi:iron complex outermembrane receptor protein